MRAILHKEKRQRTIDILLARGGHHLLHFRRWTIEQIRGTARPPRRAR
ncbi:MAG TPA: hypothetical protein VHM23_29100 [Actinomycetota bacterium]|nr:hypothetical protein [Actinomycetota bacterium]